MLPILVIDLFCGIGGFSTGAIQAGANVILAVDMWNDAIVIHTKNHPNTTHWVEELGGDCNIFMEKMQQFLIKNYGARDAYHLHIHGSPPCQNLSSLNVNRDEEEGLRLVIWTLNLIKKMKTLLITGGAGFIGSHVVRRFVNKYPEYKIVNLDVLTYAGNLENLRDIDSRSNYEFVKADINDSAVITNLFEKYQFDGVLHLAAESHA